MKGKAAIFVVLVAAIALGATWVVGHFTILGRIQQVELDLSQLSAQRDGRPPDEASVRALIERLAGQQELALVEDSLAISVEPVSESNLEEVPTYAREAKKIADTMAAPQHGESKYETHMLLVKIHALLEGRKFFVSEQRPITRAMVVAGGASENP